MPSESASFQFYRTPRVRFGAGAFEALAEEAARFGDKVLVVTGGSSLRASGRLDRLLRSLDERSLAHAVVETSGEPSPERIDEAVAAFRGKGISVVLAVGGGSVVDAGKAISAMLPCAGSVRSYLEVVGDREHSGEKLPFIAVPTTAGTGSEATRNAVLSVRGGNGFKKSFRHDGLMPRYAVVDPDLLAGVGMGSPAAPKAEISRQEMEKWIDALPREEVNSILKQLLEGKGQQAERSIKNRFASWRRDLQTDETGAPRRTATTSAMMARAISSGVCAPRSRPTGA